LFCHLLKESLGLKETRSLLKVILSVIFDDKLTVSLIVFDLQSFKDGSLLKRFEAAEEEEALRKNVGRSSANDTLGWNETWTEPGSTPVPPLQTAIPVEVVPGRCIKFSECFPLLFFPQESGLEPRMTNNRNLYEFILSTSDSCEPSDLPVGRSSLENCTMGFSLLLSIISVISLYWSNYDLSIK